MYLDNILIILVKLEGVSPKSVRFSDMSTDFFKVCDSIVLEFNTEKSRWSREIPLKNTSTDKLIAYAMKTKNPDLFMFNC